MPHQGPVFGVRTAGVGNTFRLLATSGWVLLAAALLSHLCRSPDRSVSLSLSRKKYFGDRDSPDTEFTGLR